jgi:CLIP-associating protein 1/2
MHSLALIGELAQQLGDELPESVADLFLTSLLKMAGFTKKLVATASQQAVACLLRSLAYRHKFLDLLWAHLQEKTVATRIWMCTHLCTLIETHGAQRRHALEAHNGLDILDRALKRALPDQNKDVRAKARDAFFHFQRVWPGEAERLLETLDASTKKQVAAALAEAGGPATAPSSTVGSPAAAGTPGVPAKARSASIAAVPPARRPGGPSSAILAAKRAASERLARERREAEEAAQAEAEAQAQQEGEAPADEEAQAAAEAKADQAAAEEEAYARVAATRAAARAPSTPRERPLSLLDSSPTGIPAPTTRRGHARSASSSSSQQATPRLGSDPAPSSSTPTGVAAATAASRSRAPSASSSSTPPSHGSAARLRGGVAPGASLPPPSSTRTRTASTSSSSASSVSRPTRLRAAAQQDADETTELPAALDDDVSLDLMAFSSSPIAPGPRTGSTSAFARRQAVSAEQARRHAAAAADEARQMQHRLDEPASPIAAAAAVPSASTLPPLDTPAASGTGAPVPGSSAGAEPPGTPGAKPLAPGGAAGGASWFNKRAARLENGGAEPSASSSPIKARPEAAEWVAALASGQADLRIFRRLAKLSADFPVPLASSSTEAAEELTPGLYTTRLEAREAKEALRAEEEAGKERAIGAWLEGGLFDQLWDALLRQLEAEGRVSRDRSQVHACSRAADPHVLRLFAPQSEELHAAALVVLQRLISHQHALLAATNREAALLALLLQLRRRRRERATQSACEALVDAWTARTEPILGLGTLMAALDAALGKRRAAAAAATNGNGSAPSAAEEAARVRVYTLGLRSLGRLLLRLPPELVEEELPRAKLLIKAAFGAPAVELRLAATQVIVAAHARMHDTPTLFRILAPLEESQRDLLTYYISKSTQGGRAGKMVA